MPLVRFEVRNEVGLGDPDLYGGGGGGGGGAAVGTGAAGKRGAAAAGEEEPKALLEGVAVAGLVGILRQLGDLAEFAADVFHDLHEQVIATSVRGRKVLTRVQNIEAALPSLEKAVKNQKSHIHFAYVPGSDWHTQLQNEQNHLLSSELPRFMMDSYEECRDPPRLYLLDKFDNAGAGACLKRYSDPSYFKKAWDMMRADKTANHQREKRNQKIKRKGSRLREPYHGQATSRHRSGELQRSLTAGQPVNRQFASPSTDGQSFSEHRSTADARSNPENISRSSSFSSKTRLSSVDQALDTKPSTVPHENGHDKSSNTKLHKPSDLPLRILHNSISVDDAGDDLKQGSLLGDVVAGSPCVKWDEKAAIIMSTSSAYCDDVVIDKAEDAEPTCISSVQKEIDHKGMDTLEQKDALLKKKKSPLVLNHHDEIPGEADNYMDALNTLESETETEAEFQTKNQVMSLPSFNAELPEVGAVDDIVSQHPDSSVADFTDTCQDSNISCTSERAVDFPHLSNADSVEISQLEFSDYTSVTTYKESSVITNIHESNTEGAHGDPHEISEPEVQVHTSIPLNERSPVYNQIPESKAEDGLGDFPEIPEPDFTYMVIPSNEESAVANKNLESNVETGDFTDDATDNFVSGPTISNVVIDKEAFKMAPAAKSSPDDISDDTWVVSESRPQDYPRKKHGELGDCGASEVSTSWSGPLNEPSENRCTTQDVCTNTSNGASEVSNSQCEPLKEPLENIPATQGVHTNTSTASTGVPSVKLWTNAGLFGLEPSKPPVFGAQDAPRDDMPPGFKEPQPSHSTEFTELHCSKPIESAVVDVPNGNTSISSSFVGKLVGIRPGPANLNSAGTNQSSARIPDQVHSQTDGPSDFSSPFEHNNLIGKQTSISELLESEESAENGTEMYSTNMRNDMHMVSASSFSSIAQRFLANTLQRRTPPKYTDLPMPSERPNADASVNDESTLNPTVEPSETVFMEESQFENKAENGMNGLSRSSIFSSHQYSEKSSPPLEYMKISFHPMSAFEMSKLNLDFCDGNLHENSNDMMLPTFQLLSESSIPQPGSGSESEDDTFGRSYSYSSYDDLSPRLYSNSEVWDQEDGVGPEEHELHDDSNQIGSSTAPLSSYMGFEQMNLSGVKSTISLADIGDQNGLGTLESPSVEELPNFDTLMSRNDDQNDEASVPHKPVNLPPAEDQLPPPPPLPPMQWRMTKQPTSLEEERGSTAKDLFRKSSSLPHVHTSAQEGHPPTSLPDPQGHAKEVDVQKTDGVKEITNPSSIIDIKSSLLQQIRDKSEQLKLNGHERSKAVGSDVKSLDEREELLQQIRSKTFNLRRTNASKTDTSSQSTANSNVVAILEKANAIRQAVASDEGGDDDNWSDI